MQDGREQDFGGCRVEMRDGAMQDGGVHGEVQDEGRELGRFRAGLWDRAAG